MFGEGHHPGQAGLVEVHPARPALHLHDLEVRADAEVRVEEHGELANRHAVPHGDGEEPDEGLEAALEHRAFDRHAPIGLGRSHTTTGTSCRAAARRQLAIV